MLGVEGENRSRHAGRSKGPRLVWKSALGPPADPAAFATRASRSWAKISAWMQTIKCALTHRAAQEQAAHPLDRSANVARKRILVAKKWILSDVDQQRKLRLFIDPLRWQDLRCRDRVMALGEWALEASRNECVRRAYESKKLYIEWLRGGQADGLARQHKASKKSSQWLPFRMVKSKEDHEGDPTGEGSSNRNNGRDYNWLQAAWNGEADNELQTPADVQQVVDGEAIGWAGHWAVGEAMEECAWPEEMDELEPMSVQQLRQAARSFKKESGLGWDRLHPHAFLRLPTGLLQWLCLILTNAERLGSWDAAIGFAIVVLIPKGEGGLRPIGLLPTLIRIWSKARRQTARDWEDKEWRGYFTEAGALEHRSRRGSTPRGRRRQR